MKKVDYVLLVVLITILSMSCNSKSVKSNDSSDAEQHMVTPEEVEQQLATVAEAETILNEMEKSYWSINETKIKSTFETKGYKYFVDSELVGRYYCLKNCKAQKDIEDYSYSCSVVNSDSLASAICFVAQGDMYVSAEFTLFSDDVYDMMIEQAKACGFKVAGPEEKQKYADYAFVKPDEDLIYKGKYYLRTDKAKKRIEIHYMYSLL